MENNGEIFDEIFDLKPIIPELIYSNHVNGKTYSYPSPPNFKNIPPPPPPPPPLTTWINPPPPPPPPASAQKLISFENHSDLDHNSINRDTINFSSSTARDDHSSCSNDHGYDNYPLSISKKRSAPPAAAARTPLQAQDHVVAERKRRENLGQLFISLSKAVPGLKKLDKASLLEDGINYVKALQERVRVLEEEEEERIRRSSINDAAREDSSSYNSSTTESEGPEIQARISEKQVLIKIFCRSEKGLMSRIPSEISKMNLNVVDMRIMPFGGTTLDITILAQMQREFEGTVKDIVEQLHTFFRD